MADESHYTSRKVTLGDDGELHQILDDPATSRDAIFCVHCAAPNLPDSNFCRNCGQSLLEQLADTNLRDGDLSKEKRVPHIVHEPSSASVDLHRRNKRLDQVEQIGKRLWNTLSLMLVVLIFFGVILPGELQFLCGVSFPTSMILSLTIILVWLAWTLARRHLSG